MKNILIPEILCQPNIPKPLHGLAPRTIMGQEWWDIERNKAYASTDYHCTVCGVHKRDAKKHQWLEAHEFWDIDYSTGICEIKKIIPLCHYCHSFIHSGRLSMIMGTDKSKKEVAEILEHGFKILSENNLKCFPSTLKLAEYINCKTFGVKSYTLPKHETKWEDYVLKFNGKIFKSKFKNYNEWLIYYNRIVGGDSG